MEKSEALVLPETKLRFENGILQRLDDEGNSTMQFAVAEIRALETRRRVTGFGLTLLAAGATIAWIGHTFGESSTIKILMFVIGLTCSLFGLLSLIERRLVIVTNTGTVKISTSDSDDLVEGFVVTLRNKLTGRGLQ